MLRTLRMCLLRPAAVSFRKAVTARSAFMTALLFIHAISNGAFATDRSQLITEMSGDGYVKNQLTLIFADGPVFFNHLGQSEWKEVALRQTFIDGDAIRTGNHGYAVVAYSTDDLIMVKPKSLMRFILHDDAFPRVKLRVNEATMMIAVRDSQNLEIETSRGTLNVFHGEASLQTNAKHDIVRAMAGTAMFRALGAQFPTKIPEGYFLELDVANHESALTAFDIRNEYDAFRRFNTWLRNFDSIQSAMSPDVNFRIDELTINGKFISNLLIDTDGFRIIDPGSEPAPGLIHIRMKIFPYPRPDDRFELYLNKDLVYALREGSDGMFEVKIPTPGFPEFHAKVHFVDSVGRRDRIFDAKFIIYNRNRKIEEVKTFLKMLEMAFTRRDTVFMRDYISRDYRDWFGNTYFDFVKMFEDTFRAYRDVRLVLHPHTFKFKGDKILVNMNYRLTALTGDWTYRFEDRGSELMTMALEDGMWRIRSKAKGMFFQRMKVANDLRQGILRGRVTDENTGRPITGAVIRILNTTFRTASDSMGEYVIYNVAPGKYDVEISKNGYGKITVTKVEITPMGERF